MIIFYILHKNRFITCLSNNYCTWITLPSILSYVCMIIFYILHKNRFITCLSNNYCTWITLPSILSYVCMIIFYILHKNRFITCLSNNYCTWITLPSILSNVFSSLQTTFIVLDKYSRYFHKIFNALIVQRWSNYIMHLINI